MRLRLVSALGLLLVGCGVRSVRARNPGDYQHVELRDVAPMGLTDVNVEIVASLGPMVSQEVCHGLVTFPLINLSPEGAMTLGGGVTISVPRERYAEVRGFQTFERVRVRGYLSKYFAEGCDWFMRTADRYLWVDSIERVKDGGATKSKPPVD